jgi:OmpA-OmpF porin, OOP family
MPDSLGEIGRIARTIEACDGARALVAGHTDGTGDREPNLLLSGRRAAQVARLLRAAGAPANRVATTSYAWDSPAASPEASEADRARNRRVEIVVRGRSR